MLVDTSVWVDHLRGGNARLASTLESGEVHVHPFVIGELACGNLKKRTEILALLSALPTVPSLAHQEAVTFLDVHRLAGRGIGWVDVHLLGSAMLAGVQLWTSDKRLREAAGFLGVAAHP